MKIVSLEVRRYRNLWGTPVTMSWDPVPRSHQDAEVLIVTADDGTVGIGGGDNLPDLKLLERHLLGLDPRRLEVIHRICETVDFHGGRPWIAETACADLAARAAGEPLWRFLGGRNESLLAYASTGEVVAPEERAERCMHLRMAGIKAVKLRLPIGDWRQSAVVVEKVRETIGADMEIMVDANYGWRMPGDTRLGWDVAEAVQAARAFERMGVYWLEEPLPTGDVIGYAELRSKTALRIASGEMVRQSHEARDLLVRGGVDVIQPDVVLSGGVTGARRIADLAALMGRQWSPHSWTNGIGFLTNLHVALAYSTCPFLEMPFDPPGWGPDRRDWLLPEPIFAAEDGTLRPPDGPGLGIPTDLSWLESYRLD